MLMLTVRDGDYIMLDDNVKIRFVKAGAVYKLAVDAPKEVRVRRQTTYETETESIDTTDYQKSQKRYPPSKKKEYATAGYAK